MKVVRDGVTRTVLLVGSIALKIPNCRYDWSFFLRGLLANMQEVGWWKGTRDPRLCPVLFALPGGWLVVMPRARQLTIDEWTSFLTSSDRSCEGIPDVEPKADSFGVLDGRVVAVDYGN